MEQSSNKVLQNMSKQDMMGQFQINEERNQLIQEQIANINQVLLKLNEKTNEYVTKNPTDPFEIEYELGANPFERKGEDEDIVTTITSGDQIQLESYKSIPEFSRVKGTYRSWRNQVARRMKMIDSFQTHPKYEAALGIIRAKITGAASNVLTNNKTAYNIIAILRTLDSSFADRRPLYVVEAEMTSIKQLNKNLSEYHDAINEALHLVISKIVHAYKSEEEQRSLVAEAQKKQLEHLLLD